ncbi:hypothetical protein PTKIN_Ptkin04bG0040800 [Pterospermum kingtungense]
MEWNVAELNNNPLFLSLILLVSLLIWLKLVKRKKLNLPPSPQSYQFLATSINLEGFPTAPSETTRTTAANILLYGCKDISFSPCGEYWKQIRKISVLELFSNQRIHSSEFIRDEEVELVINKISSASLKGESINLTEMLMFVSNNIVSRCLLSRKSEEEDGSSKFGRLPRRVMILFSSICVGDMFPYLRWLDVLTGLIPSLKALSGELDEYFDQIIEKHTALKSHDEVIDKKDFVSIILQLRKAGMLEKELTQDSIKAILLDLFVGGTDTTETAKEWVISDTSTKKALKLTEYAPVL